MNKNSGDAAKATDGLRQMNNQLSVCADSGINKNNPDWSVDWGIKVSVHRLTLTGRGDMKGCEQKMHSHGEVKVKQLIQILRMHHPLKSSLLTMLIVVHILSCSSLSF